MSLPRGTTIRLSPGRRFVCDLMTASRRLPLVALERTIRIPNLIAARARLADRPSWFGLFLKAYALVARERPELRQTFLTFPAPRIHQHECNVASLMIAREIDGENIVLPLQIRFPETLPLAEIDRRIRLARTSPIEAIGDFRRTLRISRLPGFVRRLAWWVGLECSGDWHARYGGTFGVTGVAALGSTSLHVLSPLSTTLAYGVFGASGEVVVRLFYDHRIMDGIQPAGAVADLEEVLNGPILSELTQATTRAA